jgi:CRISPR-associated protein Cmr5
MNATLEQQRAADAWHQAGAWQDAHAKLAKGLPALVMNSGLMQTLAFLEDKGKAQHREVAQALRAWLHRCYPGQLPSADYARFMEGLFAASPQDFQEITAEALAWLRWARQIAPTRVG